MLENGTIQYLRPNCVGTKFQLLISLLFLWTNEIDYNYRLNSSITETLKVQCRADG